MLTEGEIKYNIAEYLLGNYEDIRDKLKSGYHSKPEDKREFLVEFDSALVDEVVRDVMSALNLNYEDTASVVTREFLVSLFTESFFNLEE